MKKLEKLEDLKEGFYRDLRYNHSFIKSKEYAGTAHTTSLFYVFQDPKTGDWMEELYNCPGDAQILYAPNGNPNMVCSSPKRVNEILEDYRLLTKEEIMNGIESLRKQYQRDKEQIEIELEALRQKEIFVKSKSKKTK